MNRLQKSEKYEMCRQKMRLAAGIASRIRRLLERIQTCPEADDANRLRADAGLICACVDAAEELCIDDLTSSGGVVRIEALAREIVCGGEWRPDKDVLIKRIADFDEKTALEMAEIAHMPDALRIAMCESIEAVCRDVLRQGMARRAAEKWLRGKRVRTYCPAVFCEHALRCAAEQEDGAECVRIEERIAKKGLRSEWLAEQAHRMAAENCMRLDNLMALRRLLDSMDWQTCFDQLSQAEIELCEDEIYAGMDDDSRAAVRRELAAMARSFRMQESALVHAALKLAEEEKKTVCFYFYDDRGRRRLAEALQIKRRLRKMVPDPRGNRTVFGVAALVFVLMLVFFRAIDEAVLFVYALPLAWSSAMLMIGRFYHKWAHPARLLKMEMKSVPDAARTLVALPVLLSSGERVDEMLSHMEALGCLEQDENIDYLLLGDFRDSENANEADDEAILRAAREGVAAINRRAPREKYFYLQRKRRLRSRDGRWMGENRKRGALTALNRLLLGIGGDDFDAEGGCSDRLVGRYRYVVTLDADTQYLPGTLQKLIGAMEHPLNRPRREGNRMRGYAVLQPCMQLTARACKNEYVRCLYSRGGVDSYPVSVSDFYQDISGRGCFAGKGIYDIRAFYTATEGRLPDEIILSHDLIEGILAGAGFAGDVCFYDGCPDNLSADLKRSHRWTRGDWQLLPVIFMKGITALDRMKMIGNLLRSLAAPALLGLLIHAVWMDAPYGFVLGIVLIFLDAILHPLDKQIWKRNVLELSLLPVRAKYALDAVLRTLWRLAVSKKHLMEWVPAADAGGKDEKLNVSGRVAALLLLPGLLKPFWVPAVLSLGALFWIGADWARDLEDEKDCRGKLDAAQIALLHGLAQKTWHFFEVYVPENGCGLPPDNVQMDPPVGAARRTSPTNIGLYLLSCLTARQMGFISEEQCCKRLECSVETMEKLEKWQGQLYNWYDIDKLVPLRPRYVSAVDSGNLAAALLLCARAVREGELSLRMRRLAEGMRLDALYDEGKHLFRIGADVEGGKLSQSHYDLYASEARILSFAAMMMGQVPVKHWKRLSRPTLRLGKDTALASWSGTMFEYLMPEIFFCSCKNSLAGQSIAAVTSWQKAFGRAKGRPWGVSESGYYAFDMHLNYQYRAFGMAALALSGEGGEDVSAPYASVLALCADARAAAENVRCMMEMGWSDEYGLFEAADYRRRDHGGEPRLVKSHMAHHQGMILCALCNALQDNYLGRTFLSIPQAKGLSLLLEERAAEKIRRHRGKPISRIQNRKTEGEMHLARFARRDCLADIHLLHAGGVAAAVRSDGALFAWAGDIQLNRFSGDLLNGNEGMFVHLKRLDSGEECVLGRNGRLTFDAGCAQLKQTWQDVDAEMEIAVSPEDGTVYQQIRLCNKGEHPLQLEVTGCMAAALGRKADMYAHPAFQNLFVETSVQNENALLFRRRRRSEGDVDLRMAYLASGGEAAGMESDLEKLAGRTGSLGRAGGIADALSGSAGNVLNPCGALRRKLSLECGQKKHVHFALLFSEGKIDQQRLQNAMQEAAPDRARQLAQAHGRAVLRFSGMDARQYRILQCAAPFLMDGRLKNEGEACDPTSKKLLWQLGISGDLPIMLMEVKEEGQLEQANRLVRVHAFYRMMGIKADLVLVNAYGNSYHQPVHRGLEDIAASGGIYGMRNQPGGVYVIDGQNADKDALSALRRSAAMRFEKGDVFRQLQIMGRSLQQRNETEYRFMRPEKQPPVQLEHFNSYGGFDGNSYVICLSKDCIPPAPWSNIMACEDFGALMTDRGGGFAWYKSSRSGRLTPFANDTLREGWGWMLSLMDDEEQSRIDLLPGAVPMTDYQVRFAPGKCIYSGQAEGMRFETEFCVCADGLHMRIRLHSDLARLKLRLICRVNWLMGTDATDGAMLRCWHKRGACFASGTAPGVGILVSDRTEAGLCTQTDNNMRGQALQIPLQMKAGSDEELHLLLDCAADLRTAEELAQRFRRGKVAFPEGNGMDALLGRLQIETPDEAINRMANGFLQAQILFGRVLGRTGLYQPGGAYGFRDQLQDMLPLIHYDPQRVRAHILYCAARQFADGDVLHWWHDPFTGVRTRISDDLLFLPYVVAEYLSVTGDETILEEKIPFLENIDIPDGKEDVYAEMRPSIETASLHEHCMRAFRHAEKLGEHGLCRMGSGDWNDGMNRIGAKGRGESIWLSQFLAVCAAKYARFAPDSSERAWLTALNERLCAAVEQHGWDGQWYLRAYWDDGRKLGGKDCGECRIDVISQAWAVFAGLDGQRVRTAINAAWEQLADEKQKVIRLLTPPFEGREGDPGYIAAYPPGIRENGAQYTHAACWLACALARMDDARSHRAIELLLPLNHAKDKTSAEIYRVEPYVMAADVYTDEDHAGRGGWSWYTGSAAWMLMAILEILGYERRGNRVRLHALLGEWNRASINVRFGSSSYKLICLKEARAVTLDGLLVEGDFVEMQDDGKAHAAVFPPRRQGEDDGRPG